MVNVETLAAVEFIREAFPDADVDFRDCYYKICRNGPLSFSMDELSDIAGRPIDTSTFLVSMSSYFGRIEVTEDDVILHPQS